MPYSYTRRPRPAQLQALKKLFRCKRLLLWGDVGSGKTKVALDFCSVMISAGLIERVLVVASLTALVGTWEEQISLDAPQLHYSIFHPDFTTDWTAPVILTTYDYVKSRRKKCLTRKTGFKKDTSQLDKILSFNPDLVVFDESHRIKNPYSARAKFAHRLAGVCEYALCLTGTPQGNKKVLDLWSQFQFLNPGLLEDSFKDFKNHYCIFSYGGVELEKFKHLDKLAKITGPYIMRMKTTGLPPQVDIPYRVDLTPRAKELYRQMEREFVVELSKEKKVTAPIVLAKLTKLSQMTGGFIRDNDGQDHQIHTCKLDALQDICEELKEAGTQRVVVFARFHWELNKIHETLAPQWPTYMITGQTPATQRQLACEMYNSSGGIIIAQSGTGAEALNLQAGNYEIDFSIDYSYINYVQRRGRIHRTGQTKTCFYYQLRAKGTVDNRIYRLLEEHRDASQEFLKLLNDIRRDVK